MKIIGHRGAKGLAPENTLEALKLGLKHHVDELEFDLRVTKDNVVILHHDPEITDPSGDKLEITAFSFDELLSHKPDLATFEQVLKTIGHPVPLYVEIKPGVPLPPIIKILKSYLGHGWQPEHFLLASFSQKTLLALHEALPEIEIVVLEKWSGVRATHRARQLGTKRISMNEMWLWWGFIRQMSRGGYQLSAYTLNDPVKAANWARHGLYGVVTDYPDLFEK
ncbi:MAG: glycerophosphoryl diester phosphodiesterase [Candidatus Saccharibacteria bacterium]|nr:glycerophosphoryl diester phosphodiesterase [Candidatus Saccharibacteria bacterium]